MNWDASIKLVMPGLETGHSGWGEDVQVVGPCPLLVQVNPLFLLFFYQILTINLSQETTSSKSQWELAALSLVPNSHSHYQCHQPQAHQRQNHQHHGDHLWPQNYEQALTTAVTTEGASQSERRTRIGTSTSALRTTLRTLTRRFSLTAAFVAPSLSWIEFLNCFLW